MKKLLWTSTMIAGVLVATTAWAGYRASSPVGVSTTSRFATGALGSARNSADSTQYIGCSLYSTSTSEVRAYCYAVDSAGTAGNCVTSDPHLVQIAAAVNGESYIMFQWDAAGNCIAIQRSELSFFPPKLP